jgi:Fe-S cluster assembly protein SufB
VAHDSAHHQVLHGSELVSGRPEGKGGIYNFVTKRGKCQGGLEDFLDAGRDRLGNHLEVSELHLLGDNSVGEFYSVAVTATTSRPIPAPR